MNITQRLKSNKKIKRFILTLLTPRRQARPRLWVKWFVNPFVHHKGKNAVICKRTRMDIMPFNNFSIGKNSTIEDFSTLNNGVGAINIGNNTRIGIGSVLIGPVSIGDDVRLAQNIVVSRLNHNYEDVTKPISAQEVNTEQVYIGDETWIGANSVILPGVFIGKHCIVAAGSVVTKNVSSNTIVAGNPAKIIKKYNPGKETWERVISS